jgi:hypothetical protein
MSTMIQLFNIKSYIVEVVDFNWDELTREEDIK